MSEQKAKCFVRVQRYMSNRLLSRKQFVVRVEHGRTPLSKAEIKEKLQTMFKVQDDKLIQLYGFKTPFGGGMSKGFGLIYDNLGALKKFEPRHRLVKIGLAKKKEGARKQKKERKNRIKRLRTKITKGDKKKKKNKD